MVGAQLLGEFAWSQENLLNRLIDGTIEPGEELKQTLTAAAGAIPELIEQLEVGTEPDYDVNSLMDAAWSLADGVPTETTETIQRLDATALASESEFSQAVEQEGGIDAAALVAIEMDAALLEIFSKETASHLETLRGFVAQCEDRDAPFALKDEVRRAVHTLHGSANMASVEPIVAIAEPLDHYVSEAYNAAQRIPANALGVLEDSATAIAELLALINQPGELPDHKRLIERITTLQSDSLEPVVPTEGLEVSEFEVLSSGTEGDTLVTELVVADDEAPAADYDPFEAETVAVKKLTPEIHASGEEDAASPSALDMASEAEHETKHQAGHQTEYETAPFAADGLKADGQQTEGQQEDREQVFATSLLSEAHGDDEQHKTSGDLAASRSDYDAEIAGIFADEASELLENAEADLHALEAGTNTGAAYDDLKRQLHTLKGGARMAGLAAMGDLSHELESLLDREPGEEAAENSALLVLVQSCLDRLHKMREGVSNGTAVHADNLLLARIRNWQVPAAPEEDKQAAELPQPEAFADDQERSDDVGSVSDEPADIVDKVEPEPEFSPPVIEPVRAGFAAPDYLVPPEPHIDRRELARVDADLLQSLLDNAGEISIFRSRLEQQINSVGFNLTELSQTVTRLRDQLRKLEIETEAQILHGHEADQGSTRGDFDPLELDRYSNIQQLSRSLAETTGDLMSIQELLDTLVKESDNLLVQQSRVTTELQHGLMRTRMVPFQSSAQRLGRIVRQTASESHKQVELHIEGGQGEMDRQMLERLMPALEHMLRNAVIHGIESEDLRARRGKPDTGQINIMLRREGSETVVELRDDGGGLNLPRLRELGIEAGFLDKDDDPGDEEIMQLVFKPGLSTVAEVTQTAGRGVGMDVVANEVRKLGGSIQIESESGVGTRFLMRLPFTLAVSQALLVTTGDETYALPLTTVEGVTRIARADLEKRMAGDAPTLEYGGRDYPMQFLGALLGNSAGRIVEEHVSIPVVLVRAGEQSAALITDDMLGGREIVVKSVGPQLSTIRGISGATILGDGRTILILDLGALIRAGATASGVELAEEVDQRTFVLVVDDSITVRRVTQRLLERNGMRVLTAKDGVDAVTLMQEHRPDVILLDIEMPRMDGYEVAAHVRGDPRLSDVPIVMITSRVGLKHRARAIELGVNDYLGKPYQESQLLDAIEPLVSKDAAGRRA